MEVSHDGKSRDLPAYSPAAAYSQHASVESVKVGAMVDCAGLGMAHELASTMAKSLIRDARTQNSRWR
jgi:hypothetical protein